MEANNFVILHFHETKTNIYYSIEFCHLIEYENKKVK